MSSITLDIKPGMKIKVEYHPDIQMVGVPISTHLTVPLMSDNQFMVPVTRESEAVWRWCIPNYVEFNLNVPIDGDKRFKDYVIRLNGLNDTGLTYFVLAGFTKTNDPMPARLAEQFEFVYQNYVFHLIHNS